MLDKRLLRNVARDWFVGLTCFSLVIAPMGCTITTISGADPDPVDETPAATGMFLNETRSSDALLAGRTAEGEEYFVYGSRNSSGGIAEVDSILTIDGNGEESYIAFESGRPAYARGADGSYIRITYESISITRLAGSAELYDAAADTKTLYTVDVSPTESLNEVADMIASVTGRPVETVTPGDFTAKSINQKAKITIFSPFFSLLVLPFVALVAFTTIVLGQVLVAIYAAVALAIQAVLLVVFAPLYLIAALLSKSTVSVQLFPLANVFAVIPAPPVIILD